MLFQMVVLLATTKEDEMNITYAFEGRTHSSWSPTLQLLEPMAQASALIAEIRRLMVSHTDRRCTFRLGKGCFREGMFYRKGPASRDLGVSEVLDVWEACQRGCFPVLFPWSRKPRKHQGFFTPCEALKASKIPLFCE